MTRLNGTRSGASGSTSTPSEFPLRPTEGGLISLTWSDVAFKARVVSRHEARSVLLRWPAACSAGRRPTGSDGGESPGRAPGVQRGRRSGTSRRPRRAAQGEAQPRRGQVQEVRAVQGKYAVTGWGTARTTPTPSHRHCRRFGEPGALQSYLPGARAVPSLTATSSETQYRRGGHTRARTPPRIRQAHPAADRRREAQRKRPQWASDGRSRPSFASVRSTLTASPSRTSPASIIRASGSPIAVWISRRSGRAP